MKRSIISFLLTKISYKIVYIYYIFIYFIYIKLFSVPHVELSALRYLPAVVNKILYTITIVLSSLLLVENRHLLEDRRTADAISVMYFVLCRS